MNIFVAGREIFLIFIMFFFFSRFAICFMPETCFGRMEVGDKLLKLWMVYPPSYSSVVPMMPCRLGLSVN